MNYEKETVRVLRGGAIHHNQLSIEFYPDNALFDVVATACDALGEPTEVAWQETFEYCPKCGRKLR